MDIRGRLQTALDAELCRDKVYSHWNQKASTKGENPKEYIVYSMNSDSNATYADGLPMVKVASATIRYYYRAELLNNPTGRQRVKDRESQILVALLRGGFSFPSGAFDAGDIDGIGFGTIIVECEYWRVV